MARKSKDKESKLKVIKRYEDVVEFECPVRGLVRQKVLVKRYEAPSYGCDATIHVPSPLESLIKS